MNENTLVDYCYQNLKEGIIRGEFAPGEKLRIIKLKARLNTGPTPIREALSRLTASGLIDAEPNRGFYVKTISEAEVRDVYATFLQIERLALNQAIERGDTAWEAAILAALHQLSAIEKEPLIDIQAWMQRNYEFHYALVSACGSPCLLKIREGLYQLFDRYCYLSALIHEGPFHMHQQQHAELAQAAIGRDKEKASRLIASHLEYSLEQVINKLKKNKMV